MLNAYSLNQTVAANSAVPLNSIVIEKGCTANLISPSTINLNKRGVYEVTVDASSAAATSIALTRDGVIMPNTEMTGTATSFTTLVRVSQDNTCCCCSAPVSLQVINPADAQAVYTVVNVTVTKIC